MRDKLRGMSDWHEKHLSTEKVHSDHLKGQLTNHKGQVMNVKELRCIFSSKEKIALAELKMLDARRGKLFVYLHNLH